MDKESIDKARLKFRKECSSFEKILKERKKYLSRFTIRKLIKRLSPNKKKPKARAKKANLTSK